MIARTSDEAYEEYLKLKGIEEKLGMQNQGLNLLGNSVESERFFIKIQKVKSINLQEVSSKMVLNTNLPFSDWRYGSREISVEGFLQQLKEFVLIPRYKFLVQYNRKIGNKASWYDLPKLREFDIKFETIDFKIGEQANGEMGFDFVAVVKEILSLQREATEKEAEDFERFRFLIEEIDNLSRQLPTKSNYYSWSRRDETLEITIDKKSYNSKLQNVEVELNQLCKKYPFLKMPRLSYQEIISKLSFEDWKSENEAECEDEWSNFDDDEKGEHEGDFECFLRFCYGHYSDSNNFDE